MRITGGTMRGRPLDAPRGRGTRPSADMLREALFSSLFDVEGFRVLDLFAGTGAVGLEALSRGAAHVTFIERNRGALAALERNLATLEIARSSVVVDPTDVTRALPALAAGVSRFDLVFADPPYDAAAQLLPRVLEVADALLEPEGRLVFEYRARAAHPEAPEGFARTKERRYGEACLAFFERRAHR